MKSILRVMLWLVPVLAIGPSTFGQCSFPPPETIALTWQPLAKVQVLPDPSSFYAAQTAMTNWNNATFFYCFAPIFTFGTGTGEIMTVNYVPIQPDPNGTIPRGKTTIHTSGRITLAEVRLNDAILLTFPLALADVMDHEIGHTMGLNDCNYPGCPLYSSVMENLAPIPIWGFEGPTGGPTACDIGVMTAVAPDYLCPPPPPPTGLPPGCTCCDPCTAKQLGSKAGFLVQTSGGGRLRLVSTQCCVESPIIIDVGGQGFLLTSVAGGVTFDMAGTGNPIQIAWTAPNANNAFLALPDADGFVPNGKQLFGNFTPQPTSATPNGFAALAVYDDPKNGGNGDGIIDAGDAIFPSLRLWIDANHDGIAQAEELHTLPSLGVNSISLNYKADLRTDQYGNLFRFRAQVNPGNPASVGRMAYDVFFSTLARPGNSILTAAKCTDPGTKEGLPATDKK
jgi:hypothetical protein